MVKRLTLDFPNGTRVEGLVIKENQILAIHRINKGKEYYVLPGGGWEDGETEEQGVKREVKEEASIDIEVDRKIFELKTKNESRKVVYLCKYLGGEITLGDFNEKKDMEENPSNLYEPMWIPINNLPNITLYRLEFRDWFIDNYVNGRLPQDVYTKEIEFNESME